MRCVCLAGAERAVAAALQCLADMVHCAADPACSRTASSHAPLACSLPSNADVQPAQSLQSPHSALLEAVNT